MAATGLQGGEDADGSLYLQAANGESVHVKPRDTVTLTRVDGQTARVSGSELCRTEAGVVIRAPKAPCAAGAPFAKWADISALEVEQFDGAATVGIATVGAAVVVVGLVAAGAFNGKSKGSKEGAQKAEPSRVPAQPGVNGRTPARPGVDGRTPATPGVDGAPPATPSTPSAPNGDGRPPVVAHDARPPVIANDDHYHRSRGSSSVFVVGIAPSSSTSGSQVEPVSGSGDWEASAAPAVSFDPSRDFSPRDASPVFSSRSERRALFRPLVRGDLSACVTRPTCIAGAARVGVLFADLVDVSAGARFEQGTETPVWGIAGLGLHGAFPRAPGVALYLGSQFGFAGSDQFLVAPSAGIRLRPAGNFWIGLLPLGLTYYTKPDRAAYTPSLELAYDF